MLLCSRCGPRGCLSPGEVQNLDNELMHLALGSGNAAQMMQAGRSSRILLPPIAFRTQILGSIPGSSRGSRCPERSAYDGDHGYLGEDRPDVKRVQVQSHMLKRP